MLFLRGRLLVHAGFFRRLVHGLPRKRTRLRAALLDPSNQLEILLLRKIPGGLHSRGPLHIGAGFVINLQRMPQPLKVPDVLRADLPDR